MAMSSLEKLLARRLIDRTQELNMTDQDTNPRIDRYYSLVTMRTLILNYNVTFFIYNYGPDFVAIYILTTTRVISLSH